MTRPYDLPSMTALVCFEAAARHRSFKEAAVELSVTPAAVSHQIRGLEQGLSRPLFRRQHRGVELTEAGAVLLVALQRGFEGISEAVGEIRGRAGAGDVVIEVTTAMSAFWLTPLIAAFWKAHPEIVVNQIVGDAPTTGARADLSVHYGPAPEENAWILFRDRIHAVAAPGFAERHGIAGAADLARAPLIHNSTEGTSWTGWPDWLSALGLPAASGPRIAVNNYMISLQMAQDNVGAVLGWSGLVDGLIEAGRLVRIGEESIPSPYPFHLREHPQASAKARIFRRWLVAAHRRGGQGAPGGAPAAVTERG